jgi:DNA-directed RNA polymerase beta subunit
MEKDCTIAYGSAMQLNRRMMKDSDECEIHYCECGHLAYRNARTKTYHCSKCVKSKEIRKMNVPYVWKLMNQELMAMGIRPRMEFSDTFEVNKL